MNIKEGDIFKKSSDGVDFAVKKIVNDMAVLEYPFEAKPGETWRSGANSDMIWLWPNIRLGPIRNTACSTTWCGYRNIVGVYCEAKWSSA